MCSIVQYPEIDEKSLQQCFFILHFLHFLHSLWEYAESSIQTSTIIVTVCRSWKQLLWIYVKKKKIRRSKQKHSLNLSFPTQSLWTGSPNWWNDQLLAYRITSPYVLNHWLESFVYLQKKETNKNSLQHVAPQKKSHLYPDSRIYYLPWPLLSLL